MKYKVNDRVRIKSLDWYNENKDNYGAVYAGNGFAFWNYMAGLCGEIMTISSIKVDPEDSNKGYYFMENSEEKWTDEMIEGLVEEEKLLCEGCCSLELKYNKLTIADNICTDKVEIILQDYELKKEGDKWFAEKKKKEYPKTFLGCCDVLGIEDLINRGVNGYRSELLDAFQKLLICRDAYWQIAGEEMGLGKPWEPDWENSEERRYSIVNIEGDINLPEKTLTKWILKVTNKILVFPIEEMRDAFKENFDPDIEFCKELL